MATAYWIDKHRSLRHKGKKEGRKEKSREDAKGEEGRRQLGSFSSLMEALTGEGRKEGSQKYPYVYTEQRLPSSKGL